MSWPRGFSFVQMLVAIALVVVGYFTFHSIFASDSHREIQTQNQAAANMLAQSYMDDFRSHDFGTAPPALWADTTDTPVRVVLQGHEHDVVFHKKIEYETGALVGRASGDEDRVVLTISWREAGARAATTVSTGFPEDNMQIRVEVPVTRNQPGASPTPVP